MAVKTVIPKLRTGHRRGVCGVLLRIPPVYYTGRGRGSAACALSRGVLYSLTDQSEIPSDWKGGRGVITEAMIRKEIPDYRERTFFISGPHGMVVAFERVLKNMGVPRRRIRVDFFPGFA